MKQTDREILPDFEDSHFAFGALQNAIQVNVADAFGRGGRLPLGVMVDCIQIVDMWLKARQNDTMCVSVRGPIIPLRRGVMHTYFHAQCGSRKIALEISRTN